MATKVLAPAGARWEVRAFPTPLGWMGIVESPNGLVAVRVGHADRASLVKELNSFGSPISRTGSSVAERLAAFAEGEPDDFHDVPLDEVPSGPWTPFRRKVSAVCRQIPAGEVVSYTELARRSGAPRASRAVGTVMSRNPWPIIVPCHRVVRCDGGLGGFSAPTGIACKRRLLELEASFLPIGIGAH